MNDPLPIFVAAALSFSLHRLDWLISRCGWPPVEEMRAAAGEVAHHVPSAIDALLQVSK